MENIINLVYLVMSGLSLIITISLLLKRKKNAKTKEEQEEIDELIILKVKDALSEVRNTLDNLNIKVNNKKLIKVANKALKEEVNNGKTENA